MNAIDIERNVFQMKNGKWLNEKEILCNLWWYGGVFFGFVHCSTVFTH